MNLQLFSEHGKGTSKGVAEAPKLLTSGKWSAGDFAEGKLDIHYNKHVIKKGEWAQNGNLTKEAYLNRSRKLMNSEVGGKIEGFTSKDGWVFRYNTRTNEFGTAKPDGTIETLFRPKGGMDYWNNQINMYK